MEITRENVLDALRNVEDPDLKKDLVTLGMIQDLVIDGRAVSFTVMLTTPACPMKEMIHKACVNAVKHFVHADAEVQVTMSAQVTSRRQAGQSVLPGVKNIVAVSSGKGGVGKSTVAVNLAVALARSGSRVGLVDADVYGPSVPIMFDVTDERPGMRKNEEGVNKMIPVEAYGVKLLSIGFFTEANQAVAWRGPMASKALQQMFSDTDWGELDYLFVDLPPGTGDIHLSLTSSIPLTGAIVVSTPQLVALADARKGVAMFQMPAINVPVLGIVENMAWFSPPDLPDRKYYIFGRDGARTLAERLGVPFLGELPLIEGIREGGDVGHPAVLNEGSLQQQAFMNLAGEFARTVAVRNAEKLNLVG